jgi:hypothetical protein
MSKLKLTPEQREINRLRQSLMTIGTWARCFDVRFESPCKAMADIIKEVDNALGVKK